MVVVHQFGRAFRHFKKNDMTLLNLLPSLINLLNTISQIDTTLFVFTSLIYISIIDATFKTDLK